MGRTTQLGKARRRFSRRAGHLYASTVQSTAPGALFKERHAWDLLEVGRDSGICEIFLQCIETEGAISFESGSKGSGNGGKSKECSKRSKAEVRCKDV